MIHKLSSVHVLVTSFLWNKEMHEVKSERDLKLHAHFKGLTLQQHLSVAFMSVLQIVAKSFKLEMQFNSTLWHYIL